MNMKYITSGLFAAMIVSSTAFLTSCADDLEVGKNIDESAYSGIYENNAYLRDGKSNLVSKVVELHGETYATTVKMGLSKTPNTATSAKVKIDAAYLETYNKAHNTDFALYPQDLVTFANEGILTVNANTKSAEVEMTIRAGEGLQEDKTYAIPVAISDQSSDITIKDEEEVNAEPGDHEGLVEIGRDIEGVEVSIFVRQKEENAFKISLRSGNEVNVSDVCLMFGGGGHPRAAGGLIQGTLEQVREKVLKEVKKAL